jgi:tungstate transport system permease protein
MAIDPITATSNLVLLAPGWTGVATLTLQVSSIAILISSLVGIPFGVWMALREFRGRQLLTILLYAGMGTPPVVVGLVVFLLLSRSGPLGQLGWLFTPTAMIIAQVIISLPFVVALTRSSVESVGNVLVEQLRSLGATESQIGKSLLWEARAGVVVAVLAGLGRIISEVGAVMLVGGNIDGQTRVLTTAIVLETRRGQFEQAIILGAILIGVTLMIFAMVLFLTQRTRRRIL